MAATSIEWTDHSINPIRFGKGHFCQKISPGCANCYASRLQSRFGTPEFKGVGGPLPMAVSDTARDGAIWLDESKLREVLRRKKPTRYFWCDMTDIFGDWVPDEWLDRCFAVMAITGQHTHQVLTKRPGRMAAYMQRLSKSVSPLEEVARELGYTFQFRVDGREIPTLPWPLRNVWLGTSVEDQARRSRIDMLRTIPATVRWLSVEPLLEELGRVDLTGISWVVCGGESGPGARPMIMDWAVSILQQCKAADVPAFMKQVGSRPMLSDGVEARGLTTSVWGPIKDPKGGAMDEWPLDLRVREFPEVAARA